MFDFSKELPDIKCNKNILILLLAEVYSIQNDQEVG